MAFIINENFTTGSNPAGWFAGNTGNYAYSTSPAPLEGSFSLSPSTSASTFDLYSQVGTEVSPSWGHFLLNYPSLPASFNTLFSLKNDAFSAMFTFAVVSDGSWILTDGDGSAVFIQSAAGVFQAATTYHCFWRYKKSTGSNNGELEFWFNTANDRAGTPANQHASATNGTFTTGVSQHYFIGGNAAIYIVDTVQWADTDEWTGVGGGPAPLTVGLAEPVIGSSLF
jgi:hypothetical protein